MKSTLLSIACLLFLVGCNQKENKYWQLQLPAHFNSSQPGKFKSLLPDSAQEKSATRAHLFKVGDISAIMVVPLPVFERSPSFITMNAGGQGLDTLYLSTAMSNDDDEWTGSEDVTISPDKTIMVIDTTYAYIGDSLGEIREDIRAMSVTTRKYRVTEDGKIEEIGEEGL